MILEHVCTGRPRRPGFWSMCALETLDNLGFWNMCALEALESVEFGSMYVLETTEVGVVQHVCTGNAARRLGSFAACVH